MEKNMNDQDRQTILDEEHLKLLSIGYLVSAGMTAFFSLFALIYVFMGLMIALIGIAADTSSKTDNAPPVAVGLILGAIGLAIFMVIMAIAVLKFRAGRCIQRRRSRSYCMVVAAISCLAIPYGTLLGVFTFVVLGRDSVKALFKESGPSSGSISS